MSATLCEHCGHYDVYGTPTGAVLCGWCGRKQENGGALRAALAAGADFAGGSEIIAARVLAAAAHI